MNKFDFLQVFGLGMLGGALVELLRWWKLRDSDNFPVYARKIGYWVITLSMILAGGIIATLYGLDQSHAAALINLGASTPAILSALSTKSGTIPVPETNVSGLQGKSFAGRGQPTLRYFELVRKFIAFGN
jgi:hypothetical protein